MKRLLTLLLITLAGAGTIAQAVEVKTGLGYAIILGKIIGGENSALNLAVTAFDTNDTLKIEPDGKFQTKILLPHTTIATIHLDPEFRMWNVMISPQDTVGVTINLDKMVPRSTEPVQIVDSQTFNLMPEELQKQIKLQEYDCAPETIFSGHNARVNNEVARINFYDQYIIPAQLRKDAPEDTILLEMSTEQLEQHIFHLYKQSTDKLAQDSRLSPQTKEIMQCQIKATLLDNIIKAPRELQQVVARMEWPHEKKVQTLEKNPLEWLEKYKNENICNLELIALTRGISSSLSDIAMMYCPKYLNTLGVDSTTSDINRSANILANNYMADLPTVTQEHRIKHKEYCEIMEDPNTTPEELKNAEHQIVEIQRQYRDYEISEIWRKSLGEFLQTPNSPLSDALVYSLFSSRQRSGRLTPKDFDYLEKTLKTLPCYYQYLKKLNEQ